MEFLKKEFKDLFKSISIFMLFNFLIFNFSWFINSNIQVIKELIIGTSYQNMTLMLDIISAVIINLLYYLSLVFFVGSIILLFILFFVQILGNKKLYF